MRWESATSRLIGVDLAGAFRRIAGVANHRSLTCELDWMADRPQRYRRVPYPRAPALRVMAPCEFALVRQTLVLLTSALLTTYAVNTLSR